MGHTGIVGRAHRYGGWGTQVWWVGHTGMVGGAHRYSGGGTQV